MTTDPVIPPPDDDRVPTDAKFYVEARVGSANHRGECVRCVWDGSRFNEAAHDVINRLIRRAHAVEQSLAAIRAERDEAKRTALSHETQLVAISNCLGKDARHHESGTISGLVIDRVKELESELATARAEHCPACGNKTVTFQRRHGEYRCHHAACPYSRPHEQEATAERDTLAARLKQAEELLRHLEYRTATAGDYDKIAAFLASEVK